MFKISQYPNVMHIKKQAWILQSDFAKRASLAFVDWLKGAFFPNSGSVFILLGSSLTSF